MKNGALADQAAIQSLVERWVDSIQKMKIEGIIQSHSDNILMFDVPEPLQSKGLEEYKKTWDLFFKYSSGGRDSFQLEDLQIHSSGHIAFCTALIKLSSDSRPQCRLTMGLKKVNAQWIIIHEHHSSPHKIS